MRRARSACAVAAAALFATAGAQEGDAGGRAGAARALFQATYSAPDGRPATLADTWGRPLIVNFWARWCTPCRTEIPELARVQAENPTVAVVGINLDETPEAVSEFAAAYAIPYRLLVTRGDGLQLLRALGNPSASLPYTLAVDARGAVVGRRLGVLRRAELELLLVSLHRDRALVLGDVAAP